MIINFLKTAAKLMLPNCKQIKTYQQTKVNLVYSRQLRCALIIFSCIWKY